MAASYFDATADSGDLALLPEHLRRSAELADLAAVVEAEILAAYTVSSYNAPAYLGEPVGLPPTGFRSPVADGAVEIETGVFVMLRGYATTPATAGAAFRNALKREIAHVLRHRLSHRRRAPGVTSESDGEKSVGYDAAALDRPFPAAFPLHLRPFVVRRAGWCL